MVITSRLVVRFFLGLVTVSIFAVPATAKSGPGPTESTIRPSQAEVSQAIALATHYLQNACGADGKFVYMVDIGSGRQSSSYDVIRHAGAIYALAMANHAKPDPQVVNTMVRAAGFLRKNYVGPGVRPDQLVVWSKPITGNHTTKHEYAELGGTGLGLVALAEVRKVKPESVPLEQLQGMARFLLFLQKDDGSFVSKYRRESGAVENWESLYYPGEAALGLLTVYDLNHSPKWLNAAAKALLYLAKSREGLTTVPADHWALIATAKLLPVCERHSCPVSREELVQHAIQICNSILKDQFRGSAPVGIDGAFDPNGRTAPSATRLEGLLAALEFLPESELRNRIEVSSQRGIAFLLRAQIKSGPYIGGIPGALRSQSRPEIRVDFVQHALCAWLRYLARHGDISTGQNRPTSFYPRGPSVVAVNCLPRPGVFGVRSRHEFCRSKSDESVECA